MSGVGVAMGGLGSEAAIEVADAVILDDSPSRLPEMFSIAAKTRVVVWQNIVMALGINGAVHGPWRRRALRPLGGRFSPTSASPSSPSSTRPVPHVKRKREREALGGEEKLSEESLSSPSPNPALSSSKTFCVYRIPVRRDFRVGRKRGVVGVFGKKRTVVFLDGKGRRGKAKQQRLASRCFFLRTSEKEHNLRIPQNLRRKGKALHVSGGTEGVLGEFDPKGGDAVAVGWACGPYKDRKQSDSPKNRGKGR